MKLTTKQDAFVKAYIENGGNGTQAALKAGYSENSACEIAVENLGKPLIKEALEMHKNKLGLRHEITTDSLIAELEEARLLALDIDQPSAATAATMGKAKLTGKDKLVIEHIGEINHNHIQVEFVDDKIIDIGGDDE